MNLALWRRTLTDARGTILGCGLILFAFHWLFVWMVSFVNLQAFPTFLTQFLPDWAQRTLPVPVEAVGTYLGMLSLAYVDPIVLFTLTVYAIARGSDVVSGQLDRGTMEMLVAQPIRRITLFAAHSAVTCIGAVLLAAVGFCGTSLGLRLIKLPEHVPAANFLPAAANLLAFTIFLAALAGLVSSCQRYRWQTICWVGGFYIIELIIKVVSRASPKLGWLTYTTFFGAYEPSTIACEPNQALLLSLRYDGVLLGLAAVAFMLSAIIFCRRDLPAPL